MTDEPVNLDERRGMTAQRDTEIRRDLHEVQADQAVLRGRQEELENFLDAAPAATRAAPGSPPCQMSQQLSGCTTKQILGDLATHGLFSWDEDDGGQACRENRS